ncbi:hypothetical protein L9F63_027833 [Diploptera punctata]|uniref:Glucose-methanol-choline oxidoreductase C-terminal domain-containing protein n=1 Tax=Diploptera punctata TaxID=6984 RepID=A0AAD8A0L8_DIPPU|nr:hypothetical protein L9F63_027833 [Diploptera punctata]
MYNNLLANDLDSVEKFGKSIGLTNKTLNSLKKLASETDILVIFPVISRPKSRGRILLKSADPFDHPKIYPGYISDTKGEDIETLIDGIKLIEEIMKTQVMRDKGSNCSNFTLKLAKVCV